jgi:hypothetical protein
MIIAKTAASILVNNGPASQKLFQDADISLDAVESVAVQTFGMIILHMAATNVVRFGVDSRR